MREVHTMIRFVATATMIAAIISAGPAFAASANPRPAPAQSRRAPADDVEARIKTLHQDLRITAEQEAMWNDVAQVMRDNATRMKELRAKVQQPQPGNAVEQLN